MRLAVPLREGTPGWVLVRGESIGYSTVSIADVGTWESQTSLSKKNATSQAITAKVAGTADGRK